MPPPETTPPPTPPVVEEEDTGGGPSASDVSAMLEYIRNFTFGNDGDYTGNGGYGGDNIGPPGSKEPDRAVNHSTALLDVLLAPPAGLPGAPPRRGREVDVYSGLRAALESPDPFTGMPASNPFDDPELHGRPWSAPFAVLRNKSLLSSPYLLAENDAIACNPNRTSCLPRMKSDANQSSLANVIQAEMDESYLAVLAVTEGKGRIVRNAEVDMHTIASKAVEVARSDEYKLAFTVNQLRDHPLEIRHSAIVAGLGHMASGAVLVGVSAAAIYGSGGLLLPLGGAMGLAAGTAQFGSGLVLAFSGADSTETFRMSGQLDYVFDLTSSPVRLMFGTTGLVLSGGNVDVSHRFAIVGGFAEDAMRFRGDPSKLYSAVVPGVGTKAEKGASALLLKNMASAGINAHAGTTTSTMASVPALRPASVAEEAAIRFQDSVRQAEAHFRAHPEMVQQLGGTHTGAPVTVPQLFAASNKPAFARVLAGNAMEARVNAINIAHPAADAGFRQVGGAYKIDFVGWGRFEGLTFELTTEAAVGAHAERFYLQRPGAMIFTYTLTLP